MKNMAIVTVLVLATFTQANAGANELRPQDDPALARKSQFQSSPETRPLHSIADSVLQLNEAVKRMGRPSPDDPAKAPSFSSRKDAADNAFVPSESRSQRPSSSQVGAD